MALEASTMVSSVVATGKVWLGYAGWTLFFLIIVSIILAIVFWFVWQGKATKVYEINLVNKRICVYTARMKKNKQEGIKQLWVGKLKRFLPMVQQDDIYLKEKQDVVILLKDNNGFYHTARMPNMDNIKAWYTVTENLNYKVNEKLNNLYFLPNPHEDMDWLANQCAEADKEFNIEAWYKSPIVAYIATGFICFMMVAVTVWLNRGN